jgi:hypothetical protein
MFFEFHAANPPGPPFIARNICTHPPITNGSPLLTLFFSYTYKLSFLQLLSFEILTDAQGV